MGRWHEVAKDGPMRLGEPRTCHRAPILRTGPAGEQQRNRQKVKCRVLHQGRRGCPSALPGDFTLPEPSGWRWPSTPSVPDGQAGDRGLGVQAPRQASRGRSLHRSGRAGRGTAALTQIHPGGAPHISRSRVGAGRMLRAGSSSGRPFCITGVAFRASSAASRLRFTETDAPAQDPSVPQQSLTDHPACAPLSFPRCCPGPSTPHTSTPVLCTPVPVSSQGAGPAKSCLTARRDAASFPSARVEGPHLARGCRVGGSGGHLRPLTSP